MDNRGFVWLILLFRIINPIPENSWVTTAVDHLGLVWMVFLFRIINPIPEKSWVKHCSG
jgi:uncharacterized protein YhhL (DUF1145 family)